MLIKRPLPLVSILIPTYNQPEYFRIALKSALAQDYPNIEILVSDDSTDDRVEKVASEYEGKIKFFKHKEIIPERAYSEGFNIENLLEHSRGEYINFLMHDDLFFPNKISKMMEIFLCDVYEKIAVVTSSRYTIDAQGTALRCLSPKTYNLDILNPSGLTFITGRSAGYLMMMECLNYIGELTTTLIRKKSFYTSNIRDQNSTRYFSTGPYHASLTDVSRFLEAFQHGHLAFITEPLSAFRVNLPFQDTNQPNGRLCGVVSWFFYITLSYLQGYYISTFEEFIGAVQNCMKYTVPILFTTEGYTLDKVFITAVEDLEKTLEYANAEQYELVLSHLISRLLIYPESRRSINKYIIKTSQGLWQRKE